MMMMGVRLVEVEVVVSVWGWAECRLVECVDWTVVEWSVPPRAPRRDPVMAQSGPDSGDRQTDCDGRST